MHEVVIDIFDSLTPDLDGIYSTAHRQSLSEWLDSQKLTVVAAGAGAAAIPGMHLVGMAAELGFLLNRMSVTCYGVGAINGYQAGLGNYLEKEDFAAVLAIWSGEEEILTLSGAQLAAKTGVKLGGKIGGKIGAKLISKQIAAGAGYMVGKKLGGKVAGKVAAKIAAKLGGKALAGFVPFLGPVVAGGINYFFLESISEAASKYYQLKNQIAKEF